MNIISDTIMSNCALCLQVKEYQAMEEEWKTERTEMKSASVQVEEPQQPKVSPIQNPGWQC